MATIIEALKYPFANFRRLWNWWWVLVPIWGWFVLIGYQVRIVEEILKGKDTELPAIHPFAGLFKTGFLWTVASMLVSFPIFLIFDEIHLPGFYFPRLFELNLLPGAVTLLIGSPILLIQFAMTKRIRDGVNVVQSCKTLYTHPGPYFATFLKSLAVMIILGLASLPLITILITLPGIMFSTNYLWAEFYRENVGRKQSQVSRKKVFAAKPAGKKKKK